MARYAKAFGLLCLVFLLAVSVLVVVQVRLVSSASGASSAIAAENSWATRAPMHDARGGLGVAVVNGKIYAIGGSTQSGLYPPSILGGFVGTNEEYDPATDTWTAKASMPTPRSYFAVAVYQNKIYCIGGAIGTEKVDVVYSRFILSGANEVYDPATDTWETAMPVPKAGMLVQAVVLSGKIYLIDGNLNEVYDPATDSWTIKAATPLSGDDLGSSGMNDYAPAVVDNALYILDESTRQLLTYDEVNDTWRQGTTLSLDISDIAAGATTGVMAPKRIYFLCLLRGNNPQPTNQVYEPESDSWTVGSTIPTNRFDFGIAVVNDTLYAIGGYTLDIFPPGHYNGRVTASAVNEQYTPIGYGTVPPVVSVVSPESNMTYAASDS